MIPIPTPAKEEIDHRTIKLIVGGIAILLPVLTYCLSHEALTSISESYFEGDWPRNIFVGFLFAIGALMQGYNGLSKWDMVLSKVASIAALGIALFPCTCGRPDVGFNVHYTCATIMFLVLAYFCYRFYRRATGKAARDKSHTEAKARAWIYAACGLAISLGLVLLLANALSKKAISDAHPDVVFWGETIGLVAFGISWLTASRVVPGITRENERFNPLRSTNPP